MRVGLNLIFLGARSGGVGRYAVELARALAGRADVEVHAFTSRDEPAGLREEPWARGVRWTRLPVLNAGLPLHLAASHGALPALAVARGLDVLHSPANAGPTRVPRVACAVTLHDLIWHHAETAWGTQRAVRATRRQAEPAVRRADVVLADSEHAAAELVAVLGAPPGRTVVAPLGVRAPAAPASRAAGAALLERLGLRGGTPTVLCVAQKRPYKHQAALVRALAAPGLAERGTQLVLPGAPTPYEGELIELANELGVGDRLATPGYVSDEELEALYAAATCFALPSRLEGFGLPVLEAMVRGVPVACSDRASLPEVAGDAALLFDPDDQAAVERALERLLGDPALRARLVAAGRERARRFTWAQTAERTIAAYEQAIDHVRAGRPA